MYCTGGMTPPPAVKNRMSGRASAAVTGSMNDGSVGSRQASCTNSASTSSTITSAESPPSTPARSIESMMNMCELAPAGSTPPVQK